ncbi:MAG: 1-acyl-sn-glycerol-3-phosphate acyltransferase [Archangium sp.]|nr:1-acyl-sn-glycerol-3-phosphate acyltransferase [Archangium sp.]
MAARKPTASKKKKAAPKKKPVLPKVLGNDPFTRGSAVREIAAGALSQAPAREPLPVTPELVQAKKKPAPPTKKPPTAPTAKTPTAPTGSLSPAGERVGERAIAVNPQAHGASPTAQMLNGPTPHAASPSVIVDPRPHAGAPTAQTIDGPTAHAASPSVVVDPRPHAGAPTATTLSGPTAHAASPSVVVDPRPHAGAPTATMLRGPTAHSASPSVVVDPQPHAGAPVVVARGGPSALSPTLSLAGEREGTEGVEGVGRRGNELAATPTITDAFKGVVNAARVAAGLASRTSSVDRWGKDAALSTSLRPLAELLYDKYWRVRVEGAENLPLGPCIIVANHAGALPLDGPVLHLALRRERPELEESRWLLEDQIFHAPFVGVLANRLGAVRANPENALRLLEERRPVVVFPEGFHGLSKPFSERYQLKRFGRGGYLKIALKAGVPIIPAAIVGGEESMPLLGKIPGGLFGVQYLPITLPPLPARWHIRFAAPISMEGAPHEPEHDLAWVERKNLAVRDQVEAMLLDMLHHRDRVF